MILRKESCGALGEPRMCLALPSWRNRDSLAQGDVEERQHMRCVNMWGLSWLGNQGNAGEYQF